MRSYIFLLGAALVVTGNASAQEPSLAPRLPGLQPGWTAQEVVAGPEPMAMARLMTVAARGGADSVWRRMSGAGRGLRVGGVAGAMVGAGLGLAYLGAIQELDESGGTRSAGATVVVVGGSTVVGGVMGMGIGAAIGSLFHRRVLVSP